MAGRQWLPRARIRSTRGCEIPGRPASLRPVFGAAADSDHEAVQLRPLTESRHRSPGAAVPIRAARGSVRPQVGIASALDAIAETGGASDERSEQTCAGQACRRAAAEPAALATAGGCGGAGGGHCGCHDRVVSPIPIAPRCSGRSGHSVRDYQRKLSPTAAGGDSRLIRPGADPGRGRAAQRQRLRWGTGARRRWAGRRRCGGIIGRRRLDCRRRVLAAATKPGKAGHWPRFGDRLQPAVPGHPTWGGPGAGSSSVVARPGAVAGHPAAAVATSSRRPGGVRRRNGGGRGAGRRGARRGRTAGVCAGSHACLASRQYRSHRNRRAAHRAHPGRRGTGIRLVALGYRRRHGLRADGRHRDAALFMAAHRGR